jgi:hypothetical protein
MLTRTRFGIMAFALALGVLPALVGHDTALAKPPRFTDTFLTAQCTFSDTGSNPYLILEPGYTQRLEGMDDGEVVTLLITVLPDTLMVDGVETRVVEERETVDGVLEEVSLNYMAICEESGSVFYFGEDVDNYEDGVVVNHDGSWRSGVDGARFGLLMPGIVLLGARWFQEIAPGVALDRAEVVSLTASIDTPAGSFQNALRIKETNPLEKGGKEFKLYAPGVGLLQDEKLLLVEYGFQ